MSDAGAHVSPQWAQWRRSIALDEYEARFASEDAHGEADLLAGLLTSLGRRSILDAGCGTGRVTIELARRDFDVMGVDLDPDLLALAAAKAPHVPWAVADLARLDLGRRFDVVAMPGNVMLFCRVEDRPAVVASCVQHLEPGGLLVAGFSLRDVGNELSLDEYDRYADECELTLVDRWATWDRDPYTGGDYAVSVHRWPATNP